jgi:uncharacterized membrane protein
LERVVILFLAGLVLFLGVHSTAIVAPAWRNAQVAQRGEAAWKGVYAIASIASFALMVYGYGLARQAPILLWSPPPALRHVALLLLLPVFVLLMASGLPGRIQAVTKHPMLLAVKLWATAHLLANGTLNDVILFGAFLAWAVADRISLKRRQAPVAARGKASTTNDLIALAAGLVLYVAFLFWGHRWLIGVSPLRPMG